MIRLAAALVLLAAPLGATPLAEVLCAPTDQLRTRYLSHVGTTRSAIGIRGPEQVMEVWTDARGDWTMVVRYASGTSCIVAMGEDWVEMRPETNG